MILDLGMWKKGLYPDGSVLKYNEIITDDGRDDEV